MVILHGFSKGYVRATADSDPLFPTFFISLSSPHFLLLNPSFYLSSFVVFSTASYELVLLLWIFPPLFCVFHVLSLLLVSSPLPFWQFLCCCVVFFLPLLLLLAFCSFSLMFCLCISFT